MGVGLDEKQILMKTVEGYLRNGSPRVGDIVVTLLQNNRTSCVEQFEGEGRSVMLDEFRVDGKLVWAGYSARSRTVYVSLVGSS
jgi:hypothetical protein